jgi:hypothetical protein
MVVSRRVLAACPRVNMAPLLVEFSQSLDMAVLRACAARGADLGDDGGPKGESYSRTRAACVAQFLRLRATAAPCSAIKRHAALLGGFA